MEIEARCPNCGAVARLKFYVPPGQAGGPKGAYAFSCRFCVSGMIVVAKPTEAKLVECDVQPAQKRTEL